MRDWHVKTRKRAGGRDFSKRRYGNPLFPQRGRAKRGAGPDRATIRRWTFGILGAATAAAALWYLFWGPSFAVTDITVSGAATGTESVIRELVDDRSSKKRLLVFPQRSVFLFDKDALRTDIEAKFFLNGLEIRKKVPHGLLIEVSEKPAVAMALAGNRFMALDEGGAVIRELTAKESFAIDDLPASVDSVIAGELGAESVDLSEIEGAEGEADPAEMKRNRNPLPLLIEKDAPTEGTVTPGERAVSGSSLDIALQAYSRLPDLTGSGVRWFVLDSAAESVEAVLREGWSVHLSTAIPFDLQGERLALVLREKVGARRTELEYVDLRYDERIFFRFKDGATE